MRGRGWVGCGVVGILLLVSGCSSVTSVNPVGEPLAAEQVQLVASIEGVWANEDMTVHVKHVGDGKLRLALVKWDQESSQFQVAEMDGLFGMLGDRAILNVQDADEDKPADEREHMFFAVSGVSDQFVVLYVPDSDAFAAAVEAGDLAGEVKQDDNSKTVRLTGDAAAINAWLTPERLRAVFATEHPLLFQRVGKVE